MIYNKRGQHATFAYYSLNGSTRLNLSIQYIREQHVSRIPYSGGYYGGYYLHIYIREQTKEGFFLMYASMRRLVKSDTGGFDEKTLKEIANTPETFIRAQQIAKQCFNVGDAKLHDLR